MRLRVLLTDGIRTIDLIWLRHTGKDIYYGFVGWDSKDSYHGSGARHSKRGRVLQGKSDQHHPLASFRNQLQLTVFGMHRAILKASDAATYDGKPSDVAVWLDARTLPSQFSVSLGLLEPHRLEAMLPYHDDGHNELRSVHFVTSTRPWIYLQVYALVNPLLGDR
jgi:hypothetical protein